MRRNVLTAVLAGCLVLGGAGCDGDSSDEADASSTTSSSSPAAETTTTSSSPAAETTTTSSAPAALTFTLRSVAQGDHACYVTVQPPSGDEEILPGDFELCPGGTSDATPLVGAKVTLQRQPRQIMADSCAGDPNCTDTKTVDLVVAVKRA